MLIDAPVAAKALPLWAQLISFAIGACGFAGAAFLGVSDYLKSATLEVKLTKDSFYRLMAQGEALFCRTTLMARNGTVLIRQVSFVLAKVDGAQKTFQLAVEQFGTLIPKAAELFQEHNYLGRSTLHFLPPDRPERLVYFCVHKTDSYLREQTAAIKEFEDDALANKENIDPVVPTRNLLREDQRAKVEAVVGRHLTKMMGKLQIESGEYRLSVVIDYESSSARFRRWRGSKRVESTLMLTFAPEFRKMIEEALRETLTSRASFLMYGANSLLTWPTYSPVRFRET